MKVWIVEEHNDHQPSDLIGVASSEKRADEILDTYMRQACAYILLLTSDHFSTRVTPEEAFANEVERRKTECTITEAWVQ